MSIASQAARAVREHAEEMLADILAETDEDAEARAAAKLSQLVTEENRRRVHAAGQPLSPAECAEAADELFNVFFRLGPLQAHLDDESVEEIILNGAERGFLLTADGSKTAFDPGFASEEDFRSLLARVVARAGGRIDTASPAVDIRLPDGARLHAITPPLSHLTCVTIRRHRMVANNLEDLVARHTLAPEAARFLRAAVQAGLNMLVCGGTASGKTTTLNALGQAIPDAHRVVTIEETAELKLEQTLADCVALEARAANIEGAGQVSIRELVRHALRMRPTRIIVGEVRGPEALDMLQAMNTGHEGSMGTIHANDARQALTKLRTYLLMAEEHLSAEVASEMIAETLNLVVHLRLDQTSGRRRVTQIAEVAGLEAGRVLTNDLFGLEDDALVPTGVRPRFADRLGPSAVVLAFPTERQA